MGNGWDLHVPIIVAIEDYEGILVTCHYSVQDNESLTEDDLKIDIVTKMKFILITSKIKIIQNASWLILFHFMHSPQFHDILKSRFLN